MKLKKALIKADIIAAKQAIEYFEQNQVKAIKNIATYHLQQAAEKILKYQIYKALGSTNNQQIYTHDLSRLIGYAAASGITLSVPEYIDKHAGSITAWEAGSRYDIGFSIRIDTLKKCHQAIVEWEQQI